MVRIGIILMVLTIASFAQAAPTGTVVCVDADQYRWLRKTYDDLATRFDLLIVTRRLIDVSGETSVLKDQIKACRMTPGKADQQNCDAFAAKYEAKLGEQKSVEDRLVTATEMQEYMSTLKLRLEQPQCEK